MAGDWYTFGIALFAAIGTFLFGFDTGIATTTIAHESWIEYMGHPSEGLTGAVVAVYIAGEACGALTQTFLGDRLGRIRFMQMMCVVVTVGTVIQTAAVNMGMFLAGRVLAGIAVGGLVSTVPIYLSEISAPDQRGLIGGTSGCGISCGTMASNWVGMACSYAPYGSVVSSSDWPSSILILLYHSVLLNGDFPLASRSPGASSFSSAWQLLCRTHPVYLSGKARSSLHEKNSSRSVVIFNPMKPWKSSRSCMPRSNTRWNVKSHRTRRSSNSSGTERLSVSLFRQ